RGEGHIFIQQRRAPRSYRGSKISQNLESRAPGPLQTAAPLLPQDQLSELAVPEKRLGPVFDETNGGGAMSIDQDHLMRTQEQILIDYDRLRQEGKKHAEASQT